MTGNVHTELKGRAAAFKERDSNQDAYKKSAMPSDEPSKRQYMTKIESYNTGSDARQMW